MIDLSEHHPALPEGLHFTCSDGTATIFFDRPARKNAVTASTWAALPHLLAFLDHDPGVRVVVFQGAGSDFSAGADISEFEIVRKDAETARLYEAQNVEAFAAVRTFSKPTVAAIRGICFGGAFGIAAACDLRLAADDARFCVPPAKLGLAYPRQAMGDIVEAVGPQMARYLTFTGTVIDAATALKSGFLLEMTTGDALIERVAAICAQIGSNAPLSIKASKQAIRAALSGEPADIARADQLGDLTFDSLDYAEGRAAFREKRKPRFSGV
jgi:enoyl-CoA hydratase/carnithine racemase